MKMLKVLNYELELYAEIYL